MTDKLPEKVLAWYGDDFTGSTDVLEMLSLYGIPAVLFLERPDPSRFSGYRAFGWASSSRSRSPEWMDAELPGAFESLAALGAPVIHYKVCSTFDSSPTIGNIGRAMEIGQRVIGGWVPIVAAAPALRRYTFFGHLFAANDGVVHRIDRHPTMSRHPVTPMDEADLRLHMGRQTSRRIGLMSLEDVAAADAEARLAREAATCDAVLLDIVDQATLCGTGRLLWGEALRRPLFVVGSSGVEHALAAWWKSSGAYTMQSERPALEPVKRLLVLSGSCSPTTNAQISAAAEAGFAMVRLDAASLARGDEASARQSAAEAIDAWNQHRSVLMYSAGADAQQVAGDREALARMSGLALRLVLDRCGDVSRVVVAGGDTSSHVGSLLGIQALTFVCPLAPGAPLCRAWSDDPRRDGLEIVFKGGQCGARDFFLKVRGDS